MKTRFILSSFLVLLVAAAFAQQLKYTHSHNDYNNPIPFYKAYYAGFNSIEADVFCIDGKLLVAHDRKVLQAGRSLKELYLDPIIYALQKDTTRRLCLLIDVKDDYKTTLVALVKDLQPLTALLMTKNHPGRLKVLISGNRPGPEEYKDYPNYLFFDDDLVFPHTRAEWDRVGQVSLDFSKYSKWTGIGTIPAVDNQRIVTTVDSVHIHTGKLVRFWGAPDSVESWSTQIDFGADIIGTDHIGQLADYLSKRSMKQPVTTAIPVKASNK
jgi:alkaline phosphatase